MWFLAIEDDEGTTTFHRLTGDRCTLGRSPDNDVVLAQFNVSRRHGRLERDGEGWRYFDENSSNGSYFNGCRLLVSTLVGFSDALQLGGYRLSFLEGIQSNIPTPRPYYVPPARICVLAGPGEGTEYGFRRSEVVTLGRADECNVRLLHERIAGIHARVQPLGGGRYEIVDETGRGVMVNGQRFACKVLEGGDTIGIEGVSVLRYFERGQAPDPRFDSVASERMPSAGVDLLGLASAPPDEDSGPVSEVPPEGRVETVGPKSLPAPAPVPISFKLARELTVLSKQRSRNNTRPSKKLSFTVETPARPMMLPMELAKPPRAPTERAEVLTPTGVRRERLVKVVRRRRVLEAAVAVAAMGSAAALARGVVRSTVENAAALRPVAGDEGAKGAGPRPGASERAAPSASAPRHGPKRAALEARAKSGAASPAELRALLDLCTSEGDEACVQRVRDQLARRAPR
jgi:FHA domain-containing protein